MTQQLRWPNIEAALVAYFSAALAIPVFTTTGTETASTHDRFLKIERSGTSSLWISKHMDISISVITHDRSSMWDLVADTESTLESLNPGQAGPIYIDEVEEIFGFAYDPADDPALRQASAIFSLTLRPNQG
ncbi:hypothetical protein V5R04_15605 [Jonesiaceae bacterium BS-20]|uniref:Uncharacterized protein n=1 Tax=Jonesiaceae bacterium BS-20 TaxID=3120821 RepID=A0AAU7DVV4_9MICO